MDYKTIRDKIEDMANDNYRDFVKAEISMEKGINDENALDRLYDSYMENDSANLLNEEFDVMIEELRGQGQVKDIPYIKKEKDELVDIVGNIAGKVDVVARENKKGETFKAVNFTVVSNDSLGNKVYHNCSAYGEKGKIPKNFKQGDFVKIFGQVRTSVDANGKEHRNVNILSSKLLKAKEQNKVTFITAEIEKLKNNIEEREKDLFYADSWEQLGQISKEIERMKIKLDYLTKQGKNEKDRKESVVGTINKHKNNGKKALQSRKKIIKEMRDKHNIE